MTHLKDSYDSHDSLLLFPYLQTTHLKGSYAMTFEETGFEETGFDEIFKTI